MGTTTVTDEDLCAICGGDTDGPDVAFHWASPISVDLAAITCSDECAATYERTRVTA